MEVTKNPVGKSAVMVTIKVHTIFQVQVHLKAQVRDSPSQAMFKNLYMNTYNFQIHILFCWKEPVRSLFVRARNSCKMMSKLIVNVRLSCMRIAKLFKVLLLLHRRKFHTVRAYQTINSLNTLCSQLRVFHNHSYTKQIMFGKKILAFCEI